MYVVEVLIAGYYKTHASFDTYGKARNEAAQLRIAGYSARVVVVSEAK